MDTRGRRALSRISDERRASTRSSNPPRPSMRTTAMSAVDERNAQRLASLERFDDGACANATSGQLRGSATMRTPELKLGPATAMKVPGPKLEPAYEARKRRSSGRSHAQRTTDCVDGVAKVVSRAVPRLRARHPASRRRRDTIKRLVEPGGIAPPSERPSPQASTCVASSEVSSRSSRRRKTNRNQPQKISQPPSGAPGGHQPAKMAFRSGPRAARRERHSLIRLREQAADWQLSLFSI